MRCPAESAPGHFRPLLLLVAMAAISGCQATADLAPVFDVGEAVAEGPRHVAVKLSPEFLDWSVEQRYGNGYEMEVPLGGASGPLFCRVLEARLSGLAKPCGTVPEDVDATVIEPSVEAFDLHWLDPWNDVYRADIRYRLSLRGTDGRNIAGWSVRGTAS